MITIMNIRKYSISSDHKISDVKQTDLRKVRLRNRMKSEIEATCDSPISCLKREFLASFLLTSPLFMPKT